MVLGELYGFVSHVIRAEDNEFGTLGDEAFAELGYRCARTVCRIRLVDVHELGTWHFCQDILQAVIVCLAPAVVVVRTDHNEANGEIGPCRGGCTLGKGTRDRHEGDS